MNHIVRLYGVIGPNPNDGMYLRHYNPEAHGGRGEIVVTPDRNRAHRFPTLAEVLATYQAIPQCHPVRATDGKPNRPLTAYHMTVEDA